MWWIYSSLKPWNSMQTIPTPFLFQPSWVTCIRQTVLLNISQQEVICCIIMARKRPLTKADRLPDMKCRSFLQTGGVNKATVSYTVGRLLKPAEPLPQPSHKYVRVNLFKQPDSVQVSKYLFQLTCSCRFNGSSGRKENILIEIQNQREKPF